MSSRDYRARFRWRHGPRETHLREARGLNCVPSSQAEKIQINNSSSRGWGRKPSGVETENPLPQTQTGWEGGRNNPFPNYHCLQEPVSSPSCSFPTLPWGVSSANKSDDAIHLLKRLWWHYTTSRIKSDLLAGPAWAPLHLISATVSGFLYFDSLLIIRSHLHGIPIVRMSVPISRLWHMLSVFACLNQDPFLY